MFAELTGESLSCVKYERVGLEADIPGTLLALNLCDLEIPT